MIEYFEGNYAWNLAVNTLAEEAGNLSEFEGTLRALKPHAMAEPAQAGAAWFKAFAELGDRVEGLAQADARRGNGLSAARRYHRASMYFMKAERMASHHDPERLRIYRRSLAAYRQARELNHDPVEFVRIPYKGGYLPALFVQGEGTGPRPVVAHLQGFDSVKESQYPYLGGYRRRGLSTLIVDQPGTGEAIREYGLTAEVETENYGRVIVDYLQTRADVDAERIGLAGISMGGYYAPRAASFDPRVKACGAWGALYDVGDLWRRRAANIGGAPSLPNVSEHATWCFGVETAQAFLAKAERMTLKGLLGNLRCPFLVTHGENDRQVPLSHAHMTIDEAGSTDKELKIFTLAEGGAEHCQLDNRYLGADHFADWFARRLGGTTS